MTTLDGLDAAFPEASPSPSADGTRRPAPQAPEGRVTAGVVVTIKRRRAGRAGTRPGLDGAQDTSAVPFKAPRVFRLAPADAGVTSADQDVDATAADGRARAVGTSEALPAEPAARRRRPRDPVRAPGKVTSIVYPARPVRTQGSLEPDRPANPFMGTADAAGYARVMADLEAVQEILDLASSARDFRLV